MLEDAIAYLAVACAAIYAARRLLPASTRIWFAELATRLALRLGWSTPAAAAAARRQADAPAKSPCGNCGGCAGKTPPPAQQTILIRTKH